MDSISNSLTNFINDHKHETDEQCPIHHVPKVIFGKSEPFCPICQKIENSKRQNDLAIKYTAQVKKRRTSEVLKKDSLITDEDLKGATFDSFEVENDEQATALHIAKQSAYKYLDKTARFNTLFTGQPGSGKSHLALSMLKAVNEHSKQPQSCLFISTDELFRRIKASFDYNINSRYSEANMVELLTSVDLLVLDDLGSEASMSFDKSASDFVQRILFGIFNSRSRTIITTNLNASQLEKMYNSKLVSRMEKGIKGHLIKFTDKTKDKRLVDF